MIVNDQAVVPRGFKQKPLEIIVGEVMGEAYPAGIGTGFIKGFAIIVEGQECPKEVNKNK